VTARLLRLFYDVSRTRTLIVVMNEERIAAAVIACLHHATQLKNSVLGVRDYVDELSLKEWSPTEIEEVRRRALRVLALVHERPE
jgi:hypothetical protein